MSAIDKLALVGGESLGGIISKSEKNFLDSYGDLGSQLKSFLKIKNGFYAFESALHVFHIGSSKDSNTEYNLEQWNDHTLWKKSYGGLLPKAILCFAEDLFGGQFCIFGNEIVRLDPETADIKFVANNFETWAGYILSNYEVETAYPLAHSWQMANSLLFANQRLLPKVPFVIGGGFNIDNLFICESVSGMQIRGEIAKKISNLPDGTEIEISYSE